MESHVNRRLRDKAMVFGLPANRFMVCLAAMCAPVMFVLFWPILFVAWLPWMVFVYKVFQKGGTFFRSWRAGKRFPVFLKNR